MQHNVEEYTPAAIKDLFAEERRKLNWLWTFAITIGFLIIILLSVLTRIDEFLIYLIYNLKPCN